MAPMVGWRGNFEGALVCGAGHYACSGAPRAVTGSPLSRVVTPRFVEPVRARTGTLYIHARTKYTYIY